eukprot:1001109-Karenia_brevis.AAC.1
MDDIEIFTEHASDFNGTVVVANAERAYASAHWPDPASSSADDGVNAGLVPTLHVAVTLPEHASYLSGNDLFGTDWMALM